MKKNTAGQVIGAQMVSATTGAAFTGAVTAYVTKDGGLQALGAIGGGIATHEGNGYFTYTPSQDETNADHIAFSFIGTGAIPALIQVYTEPQAGTSAPAPAPADPPGEVIVWADMTPDLSLDVPDCPQFTMERALQRAATEFCRDTRAWRATGVVLATTTAGQQTYAVTNAAGTQLCGLPAVWIDGEEVGELPDGAGDDYTASDTTAAPMVGVVDAETISLAPAPTTSGRLVTATVALIPSPTATGLPDWLYRRHRLAIKARALEDLLMMRGKPWSDPPAAMAARQEANRLGLRASSEAGPKRRRASLRVKAL